MIIFYTNRELSHKLGINLARWKRWSREFLPPDPLGGLQSGYARQYNADQAFTVYLGGRLVGDLKYTIPEARLILNDLHNWLVAHRFYADYATRAPVSKEKTGSSQSFQIAICPTLAYEPGHAGFFYHIRGVMAAESSDTSGGSGRQERFIQTSIDPGGNAVPLRSVPSYRVLNISIIRQKFLSALY